MDRLTLLAGATALLLAAGARSATDQNEKMMIDITTSNGEAPVSVVLDSDSMGFSPHDLQLGESRSVVDKSGRTIFFSRTESGLHLSVDGREIDLPEVSADHHVFVSADHEETFSGADAVTVLTGRSLDDTQKAAIRASFAANGIGEEIHFVDVSNAGGSSHKTRIVKVVKSEVAEH